MTRSSRKLLVKDWKEFQHYRDRRPPWIKFHRAVLEDYTVAQLPDVAKAHLFGIWLLAATDDGRVPYDAEFIRQKINATEAVDLDLLIGRGLLQIEAASATASAGASSSASKCASAPRSPASAVASTSTEHSAPLTAPEAVALDREETETEERREEADGDGDTLAGQLAAVRSLLPPEHHPAFEGYRRIARFQPAFLAEILRLHDPITGGQAFDGATIGQALSKLAANGEAFNVSRLAGYCRRLVDGPPPSRRPLADDEEDEYTIAARQVREGGAGATR